jgi:hypothetical protein
MQTNINRLNKDVVDLTQDADENIARHLRDEMKELNENWSHIISSTKVHSQHIQVNKICIYSQGKLIVPNNHKSHYIGQYALQIYD